MPWNGQEKGKEVAEPQNLWRGAYATPPPTWTFLAEGTGGDFRRSQAINPWRPCFQLLGPTVFGNWTSPKSVPGGGLSSRMSRVHGSHERPPRRIPPAGEATTADPSR